jgi:hypothetical protein
MNSKTIALLFAMVSLGGMIAVPGLSMAPTTAYAQSFAGDLVDGILDDVGITDEEDEEDTTDQSIEQPIDQAIDQDVDQSEHNDQDNDNTQTQVGAIDQDIAQGIVDGDDSAKSKSESGDAKKYSTSSSSSGDAANVNDQLAENNADLTQDQSQTVDQDNTATFGDDTADLDAANVAVPIAVPINVDENEEEEEPEVPPTDGEDDTTCVSIEGGDAQEISLELLNALELLGVDVEVLDAEACLA